MSNNPALRVRGANESEDKDVTTTAKPTIGGLANWYGSNRIGAARVGELLAGCKWVGIPFCGGCCEIPFIKARTIVANDLHQNVITLATIVSHETTCGELQETLNAMLFHPATLAEAQEILAGQMVAGDADDAMRRAYAYFVVAWMTRSGTAGTNGEATGKLCLRWEAGGGDSAKRWRSAIESLPTWHEHLKRCTFSCLDFRNFLAKCKDQDGHGIYCDPPFPGPGDKYTHGFSAEEHLLLAMRLEEFIKSRIVIRYYDVPAIRNLYKESDGWTWHEWQGRKQTNGDAPEVLIVRN